MVPHPTHSLSGQQPWCAHTQHLPRALEGTIFSKAATQHTTQNDCVSHFTCFSFQQDELKLEGANESLYQTNFHSDCQTWKSDILKKPFWNPGRNGTGGRLLKWLISTCPCLCLPKEDGTGTGCRHSRGGPSAQQEQQSWQLCSSAPNTLGINAWAALLPSVEFLQQAAYL